MTYLTVVICTLSWLHVGTLEQLLNVFQCFFAVFHPRLAVVVFLARSDEVAGFCFSAKGRAARGPGWWWVKSVAKFSIAPAGRNGAIGLVEPDLASHGLDRVVVLKCSMHC